tara:strand:+ start:291 stop:473 length:183 start_codon:yes stop_codon:yes gene_type:complete
MSLQEEAEMEAKRDKGRKQAKTDREAGLLYMDEEIYREATLREKAKRLAKRKELVPDLRR